MLWLPWWACRLQPHCKNADNAGYWLLTCFMAWLYHFGFRNHCVKNLTICQRQLFKISLLSLSRARKAQRMFSYLCVFLLDNKTFICPGHFAFVRTISVEIRPGLIKAISLLFCIKTSGKHCLCFAVPCEAPLNVLRRCFQLQEPHVLS